MTDELSVTDDVVEEVATEEADTPMSGESPEESGETGDDQESNEKAPLFSDEGQKVFNSKMAEAKRQQRELEAEKQNYANQLKQLQSQLPQNQRPEVPKVPSEYDFDTTDEFHKAVATRDAKIQDVANWNAQERFNQMRQERQQAQVAQAEQDTLKGAVENFQGNATKHGIDADTLNMAINQVNQYGINQELGMHIMDRSDGPLIAQYLANNPLELDKLNSVSPLQAAVMVESQISAKAAGLKKRTTSAPDPVEPHRGAGAPTRTRGPKGATYT